MRKQSLLTTTIALVLGWNAVLAADVALGKKKYIVCAGCHGPTGSGNAALKYPALAGRDAGYISAQLRAFKAGKRDNAAMKAMAAGLNEADIDNIAAYIATMK